MFVATVPQHPPSFNTKKCYYNELLYTISMVIAVVGVLILLLTIGGRFLRCISAVKRLLKSRLNLAIHKGQSDTLWRLYNTATKALLLQRAVHQSSIIADHDVVYFTAFETT